MESAADPLLLIEAKILKPGRDAGVVDEHVRTAGLQNGSAIFKFCDGCSAT